MGALLQLKSGDVVAHSGADVGELWNGDEGTIL
jgi:hypothetical protein